MRTRVLGIDPGSRKAGWGVVDVVGTSVVHVDNGVLMLDSDSDLTIRLVDLAHRLNDVITTYAPDRAAVEDVFVQKSARSALVLGQARGAALTTLGLRGLKVTSYTPSMIKQRVTGGGRADKEQVASMVTALLGLPEYPFEDAADALAVAICAAFDSPLRFTRDTMNAGAVAQALVSTLSKKRPASRGRDALAQLARAQGKA
jgi:crossover junction endodeoxyribonuclease RuvC